ncbi:MAG: cell division protein ZapA [Bacteroidota bacterium]|jgi:cell division protein ZapA|nr:cell division protein ZapA [Bacteroidota bacterium]MDO9039931.1 cell division protein ZapA [Bacteroidota bacterium]MDO9615233.1 cell division protein ZapA [Bacteroidota bacterium]MDP2114389.1 cell division protein ZapA [Bacteroidota bacterium]MDP3433396.1 cell division protein ZapA [Bacteroidota bacterium]
MTDKLSIKIKIDGREYPLKVDRDDEEKYRKAAKIINDIILQYRQKYSSSSTQDFLAMTAFQFALKTIDLEEKVDRSPLFDELKKLDEELSDYLSLKE